jgi:hypothetical protein
MLILFHSLESQLAYSGSEVLTCFLETVVEFQQTKFADKRRSLGWYSSLADWGHGVFFIRHYIQGDRSQKSSVCILILFNKSLKVFCTGGRKRLLLNLYYEKSVTVIVRYAKDYAACLLLAWLTLNRGNIFRLHVTMSKRIVLPIVTTMRTTNAAVFILNSLFIVC